MWAIASTVLPEMFPVEAEELKIDPLLKRFLPDM